MFFLKLEKFCLDYYRKYSVVVLKVFIIYALAASVFSNAKLLTQTLYTGEIKETFVRPLYGFMKSPDALENEASNKFGADYLCLYSAAKNYSKTGIMYSLEADPWGRPAMTFPPQLIFLTSHLVPFLNFPKALLFNNYLQIFIFLLASIYFMKSAKTSSYHVLFGTCFTFFLLFNTTVGMTWFERGQTDLFTGTAVLLLIKGIKDELWFDFLLAGIFLSLKWSGIPFFTFFSICYLFTNCNRKAFFNIFLAATPAFIFLIPFSHNSLEYLNQIRLAETTSSPVGISLISFYPRYIARLLPFFQTYLFIRLLKNRNVTTETLRRIDFFYIATFAYVCCAFGTYAFEYRVVSLLFLIPLFMSKKFIFTKSEVDQYSKFYFVIFGLFIAYVFKFESLFVYANKLLGYKRGFFIFNALTFVLLYLHLKHTNKWSASIDVLFERIQKTKWGKKLFA